MAYGISNPAVFDHMENVPFPEALDCRFVSDIPNRPALTGVILIRLRWVLSLGDELVATLKRPATKNGGVQSGHPRPPKQAKETRLNSGHIRDLEFAAAMFDVD